MKTFAERLKHYRAAAGIESAEQFAHRLRMTPHAYRKYERGQSEPNFETLTLICELLAITPNDLLPHSAEKTPKKKGSRPTQPHVRAA